MISQYNPKYITIKRKHLLLCQFLNETNHGRRDTITTVVEDAIELLAIIMAILYFSEHLITI